MIQPGLVDFLQFVHLVTAMAIAECAPASDSAAIVRPSR